MGTQRNDSLDGVRALAALMVVFFHAHVPGFAFGAYGVQVFFVLSGYLITSLLAAEIQRDGSVNVGAFIARRARRLVPALVLLVAVVTALTPILLPVYAPLNAISAMLALTYTTNLGVAVGLPWVPLAHTWTLALEMQFYVLWPLVISCLLKLGRPVAVLLTVAAALWAAGSWLNPGDFNALQIRSVSALLLGAAVALLPAFPSWAAWSGAVAVLAATFAPGPAGEAIRATPALHLGAALMISGLRQPSRLSRALSWPPLVYLGLISYGIYLWHAPFTRGLLPYGWTVSAPVALAASILLAALSFHTVEKWAKTLWRAGNVRVAHGEVRG